MEKVEDHMSRKTTLLLTAFLVMLLTGCSFMPGQQAEQSPLLMTQIAEEVHQQQTIQAAFTRIAEKTQASFSTATWTPTPSPTSTASATPTPLPPTPTATWILLPTATRPPPTPIPCNWVGFIKDVTIKDGTRLVVGEPFTKTWRLKNIGACTWTRKYALAFVSGSRMNGAEIQYFENQVKPGQVVDVSVRLKTPNQEGTYTGYWMLRDQNGRLFGLGKKADDPFWVKIKAQLPPATPTFTPTPTATATSLPPPCLRAQYVADVTIPDNTLLPPGAPFTKIWRLKNSGQCTWTPNFNLVFVQGNQMQGPSTQALNYEVKPGSQVDVAVNLVAPSEPGPHQGYWMLRDTNGVQFGIGEKGDQPFWVKIQVQDTSLTFYDFVKNICAAEWRSRRGALACPHWENPDQRVFKDNGKIPVDRYKNGFFSYAEAPRLEASLAPGGPALVVRPDNEPDGFITASFPALAITRQHRFRAVIGCTSENPGCDVTFQVNYRLQDEPVQVLGFWRERYDGQTTSLDIDLSFLAGQQVWFELVLVNNGQSSQDWGFWLQPRIVEIP
jgi:hypothetical protein